MAPPSSGQMRSVTLMSLRLRGGCLPSRRTLHRCAHILAAVHFAVPIGIPAAVGHLAVVHCLAALLTLGRHLVSLMGLGLGRHSRQRATAHRSVLGGAGGGRCGGGLRSSGGGESKRRSGGDKNGSHVDSPDGLLTRRTAHSIDQKSCGGRGSACGVSPRTRDETKTTAAIGESASGSASWEIIDSMPEHSIMQSIMHSTLFAGACSSEDRSREPAISAQCSPLALASAIGIAAIAEVPPSIPNGAISNARNVNSRTRFFMTTAAS